jgi:site-specific recombinase XerD
MVLSSALEWYLSQRRLEEKTQKNYRTAIKSFTDYNGDLEVQFIGKDHFNLWHDRMKKDGISGTTQNGYFSAFRQLFGFLSENEFRVISKHVIKPPKRDTKPSEYLKPEEVAKLIDSCKNPRDKAICYLLFNTGCRVSEIRNLDKEHFINAEPNTDGFYTIWVTGKGNKYREVTYNSKARALVELYLNTRNDYFKPLFISGQHSRISVSRIEQILAEASAKANIRHTYPHLLRHSYTTDLIYNGAPIKDVQHLLGHAKIATTLDIYTHRIDNRKHETQHKFQSQI